MTTFEELRRTFAPAADGRLNADVREFMVRMKAGGRAASIEVRQAWTEPELP